MENRNSLQPIRTAAPADRLLGRVCSVGGRRYLDCGFDQLIAVSDADAARYADGAFVEVEIAAGATPCTTRFRSSRPCSSRSTSSSPRSANVRHSKSDWPRRTWSGCEAS